MKKVKVNVSGKMTLRYDEDSQEIWDAFENYKKVTWPGVNGVDIDDMLEEVVWCMVKYGNYELEEYGIGNVLINGKEPDFPNDLGWCGIDIAGDFPDELALDMNCKLKEISIKKQTK
jgi:hypothetical protein